MLTPVWLFARGPKSSLAALLALGVAINLDLWLQTGVRTGGDTTRYTGGAEALLEGGDLGQGWNYLGYVALVAASRATGVGDVGLVAVQVVLMLAAAVALWDFGRQQGQPVLGWAAALLWLSVPDFTRFLGWQTFVLTDAVLAAVLVLTMWATERARGRSWRFGLGIVLALGVATLNPHGWVLASILVAYLIVTEPRWSRGTRAGLALGALAMCAVAISSAPNRGTVPDPGRDLRDGRIFPSGVSFDHWQLSMPDFATPRTPVEYVAAHPVASLKLALARAAVEAARVRPAMNRNGYVVFGGWALVMWALATLGIWCGRRSQLVQLCAALVAAQLAFTAITFADADGRWLAQVAGPLAVLAGFGIVALNGAWARARSKGRSHT
ncbi:MAG: glycosyltransferase family 39 protein [Solirubrobacteraceae bacterium]